MSAASTRPPFPRLAAPLRQQVTDALRQGIISNRYPAGSRLVEHVICDELRVSRTVVREALRQLEAERLIELIANVGPIVRSLSLSEARSLYEVRAALESLAGRACATNASDDLILRLHLALTALKDTDPTDIEALLAAKDEFTRLVIEGSGNEVVGDMLSSIHARVNRLRANTLRTPGRLTKSINELEAICIAVTARNPEAAAAACRQHVESAGAIAIANLVSEQGPAADGVASDAAAGRPGPV